MIAYFNPPKERDAKIVTLTGQVLVYYGVREDGSLLFKKFSSYPAAANWLEKKGYKKR